MTTPHNDPDAAAADVAVDSNMLEPAGVTAGVTAGPDLRELALARGRALAAGRPWSEVTNRLTVLLTSPPLGDWRPARAASFWIIVDDTEVRALPEPWRGALAASGIHVEHRRTDAALAGAPLTLTVSSAEAALRSMDAATRRGMEVRWLVRQAQSLHDPLGRLEMLTLAARRAPAEMLERVLRPLYLQAVGSIRGLAAARPDAVGIGEAAGVVARIACVVEAGNHPPAEWLLEAAAATTLGQRLHSWLDDIPAAAAGDTRALRWVAESGDGVLRELHEALRVHVAERDWFLDPESTIARPPR